MFEKILVYAFVGNEEIHCGSAELSINLESTSGHGSLLLDLYYFPTVCNSEIAAKDLFRRMSSSMQQPRPITPEKSARARKSEQASAFWHIGSSRSAGRAASA
jgi:hypothetical protein